MRRLKHRPIVRDKEMLEAVKKSLCFKDALCNLWIALKEFYTVTGYNTACQYPYSLTRYSCGLDVYRLEVYVRRLNIARKMLLVANMTVNGICLELSLLNSDILPMMAEITRNVQALTEKAHREIAEYVAICTQKLESKKY